MHFSNLGTMLNAIQRKQAECFKDKKKTVNGRNVVVQVDFTENCTSVEQESAHWHRCTGQIHLGGQAEFCPNGEHKLFSRGPARETKIIMNYCAAYFFTVVE